MPRVAANGIELYYEERGHGEPLLLMAPTGWPGSVWDLEQTAFFSQTHRVITYDYRGVGRSDQPDEPYSTALLAEDALALLHAIGAAPAHVLGFSMGGRAAQIMALESPQSVRSLILAASDAGSPHGGGGVPFELAVQLAEFGYRDHWPSHLNGEFPLSPGFRAQHPEKVQALMDCILANCAPPKLYLRHVVARGSHYTGDRLGEISVPTLVLVGAEDRRERGSGDHVEAGQKLAAQITNAEFATVAGARHLFLWEAPELGNRAILDFIQRHQQ